MEGAGIFEALDTVFGKVQAIQKARTEKGAGYHWRTVDDVINGVRDLLGESGIHIRSTQLGSNRETIAPQRKGSRSQQRTVVQMKFTFIHRDGSSEEDTVEGESLVSDGTGTVAAIKTALKTCLEIKFLIKTGEEFKAEDMNRDSGITVEEFLEELEKSKTPEDYSATYHDYPEHHSNEEFLDKSEKLWNKLFGGLPE
jgi:hypothetical protein